MLPFSETNLAQNEFRAKKEFSKGLCDRQIYPVRYLHLSICIAVF